jgi:iron complex outermembrane receptor protein
MRGRWRAPRFGVVRSDAIAAARGRGRRVGGLDRWRHLLVPLAALCASPGAGAQGADAASPAAPAASQRVEITGTRLLDTALTRASGAGSRLDLTPLDTPASVSVLDGERVRELGLSSLIEAKTLAPGLSSANNPGNGGNLLNARGFSGQNSVKQLYRGLEIFNAGGVVSFPFDPWNVDRIETLAGPASVLYGAGAIGGAVNVVPLAPQMDRLAGRASLGLGSFRSMQQAIGLTGPLGGGLGFRLDASHRSSDGWVDRGESDTVAVSAALHWEASERLRLTAAYDYGQQHSQHDLGTPVFQGRPAPGTIGRNYNIADNRHWFEDRWWTLALDWQVAPSLGLASTLYRIEHDRAYRDAFTFTYLPATASAPAQVRRSNFRHIATAPQRQYGQQSTLRWDTSLAGIAARLLGGIELGRMHYDREDNVRGGSSSVDALAPVPGVYLDFYSGQSRRDYVMRLMQAGAFAEARLGFGPAWSLNLGVRHDRYRNRRDGLASPGTSFSDLEGTGWHVGTVWQPAAGVSLYAQSAAATDPVAALASIGAAQQGFDLSPGRQVEAGAKAQQRVGAAELEWTLAAYKIVKRKLLTTSLANPALSEQVGQQSSRGIELALGLRWGPWRVDANGTVLDPTFDDFLARDGNVTRQLAGLVPLAVHRRSANLIIGRRFGAAWQARLVMQHLGRRYTNNLNTTWLPPYTRWDAGLAWQASPALRLDARIENLGDKVYGTQGSSTQWILGRPRAVSLAGVYAF